MAQVQCLASTTWAGTPLLVGTPLRALIKLFGSYDLLAPEQVAEPICAVAELWLPDSIQCKMFKKLTT